MHQLLLLRHAKSAWEDAALPDRDRPLNKRGRRSAIAIRHAMHEFGLIPDLVLVSSARRTVETMNALEPWDDTPLIEPMDDLYLAKEALLLATLQAVAETVRTVLLIGHNPGLHDLSVLLADQNASAAKPLDLVREGFPSGALAEFTVTGPWFRLGAGGARLVRFLTPRMLDAADRD